MHTLRMCRACKRDSHDYEMSLRKTLGDGNPWMRRNRNRLTCDPLRVTADINSVSHANGADSLGLNLMATLPASRMARG